MGAAARARASPPACTSCACRLAASRSPFASSPSSNSRPPTAGRSWAASPERAMLARAFPAPLGREDPNVKSWLGSLLAICILAPAALAADKKTSSSTKAPVDTLAQLERAVARDSSNFENLMKLGTMYVDRDRPLEAQRVLARANV